MNLSKKRRNRTVTGLELQRRLIREDAAVSEDAKRNLVSRSLGIQRRGLTQEEIDIGMGLIEARRALLVGIPTIRGVERVHAVIRLMEKVAKLHGALRRHGRKPVPVMPRRRAVPTRGLMQDDNGGDEAAGGES